MRFDVERAYQLAKFSQAAYRDESKLDADELKVDFVKQIGFDAFTENGPLGISVTLGGTRKDLILAFRGTVFEIRSWESLLLAAANWIIDLAFDQVEHARFGWRIHSGFSHVINHVWEEIDDTVRSHLRPGQRLWITGHSLGGALANLAANEFSAAGIVAVAGAYTYGAPRVGDAAFASAYHIPHFRIENGHDVVPHLPPPPSLVGLGRMILAGPLDALEELLQERTLLAAQLDGDFARDLAAFLGDFVDAVRRLTSIEYKHAGALCYFDPDGDLIDLNGELELPAELRIWIDEDDLKHLANIGLDLLRFVAFLVQLVEGLQNLNFRFLADHRMASYLNRLEMLMRLNDAPVPASGHNVRDVLVQPAAGFGSILRLLQP